MHAGFKKSTLIILLTTPLLWSNCIAIQTNDFPPTKIPYYGDVKQFEIQARLDTAILRNGEPEEYQYSESLREGVLQGLDLSSFFKKAYFKTTNKPGMKMDQNYFLVIKVKTDEEVNNAFNIINLATLTLFPVSFKTTIEVQIDFYDKGGKLIKSIKNQEEMVRYQQLLLVFASAFAPADSLETELVKELTLRVLKEAKAQKVFKFEASDAAIQDKKSERTRRKNPEEKETLTRRRRR